jgi:antitoxin (DNA-binding transcriptional repressor) of toxin-antitoxin stability system
MSEQPVSVRADDLRAASEQVAAWKQAVRRAEGGEAVAVLAHGRHVADIVPSGEIERLREMIEVLSDNDLLRDLHTGLDDLRAGRVVSADDVAEDLGGRTAQQ